MNTSQIFDILRRRCGSTFVGVYAKDRLPKELPHKRPLLLVCNTDPHDKPGEHWVVLFFDTRSRGEYFDSMAEVPDRIFEKYLNKYCSNYVRSELRLQSFITRFCGHYCIFYSFLKYLGYSFEDILNCFTDDNTLNDIIAHKFVCEGLK